MSPGFPALYADDCLLQRHFSTFAVGFPGPTSLLTIYQTFLDGHFKNFSEEVQKLSSLLINGALGLHTAVASTFRKTAKNFHYDFNIRHLSNVFQVCVLSLCVCMLVGQVTWTVVFHMTTGVCGTGSAGGATRSV